MTKNGTVRSVSIPQTVVTQILGPSEKRCALLFSPPTTSAYTISTEPVVAFGSGLNMLTTTTPILITHELFGDAIYKPWYAVTTNPGGLTVSFIETVNT
jgi:hypothetical protein